LLYSPTLFLQAQLDKHQNSALALSALSLISHFRYDLWKNDILLFRVKASSFTGLYSSRRAYYFQINLVSQNSAPALSQLNFFSLLALAGTNNA